MWQVVKFIIRVWDRFLVQYNMGRRSKGTPDEAIILTIPIWGGQRDD